MPRIRSIKPEFWTDEKTGSLPSDTALFFIGLWNHADDFGYFSSSSRALSLCLPRWRPQVVESMLRRLEKDGLIKVSRSTGVGQVIGWHHQKIKDRRLSKWNDVEIKWDEPINNAYRSAEKAPGSDRRGKDRKGEESYTEASPSVLPPEKKIKKSRDPITNASWDAYSKAYKLRHNAEPVRNAMINFKLAQLVGRLGADAAPKIAEFYLTHNDPFYVKNLHPVGLMLQDAEKLHTEWMTGRKMTTLEARGAEKTDEMRAQFQRLVGRNP